MIVFENIAFAYPGSAFRLVVASLHVAEGEQAVLIGPSGSGKTTLLNMAAGIIVPDTGTVRVDGAAISQRSDAARRNFRASDIGMVFQEFELLEYLTVRENILLPYRINAALKLTDTVRATADELAARVGITETLNRRPNRLSQGERQRVAICRALVTHPRIILADEPTGNLDPDTSRTIVDLLLAQASAADATLLMVTHDHSLLDDFDRTIDISELAEPALFEGADT